MKCPSCEFHDSFVIDTRTLFDGTKRRFRVCKKCQFKFTTFEKIEINFPKIIKKDGRREDYESKKLQDSFFRALRKCAVKTKLIDEAILRVEEQLQIINLREISTNRIGDLVMNELFNLNKIAYIRFASVYLNFTNIEDFNSLVNKLRISEKS